MLNQDNLPPDNGPYALCQTIDELLVVVSVLHGLDAVDQLLVEVELTREMLHEAANQFASIGHKPLAALVRKHARRAQPAPERGWWMIPDKAKRRAAFERQGGVRPRAQVGQAH